MSSAESFDVFTAGHVRGVKVGSAVHAVTAAATLYHANFAEL